MILQNVKDHIEHLLGFSVKVEKALSGGDISQAYLLKSDSEQFFIKINTSERALEMFEAEARGLRTILKTDTIACPDIIDADAVGNVAFLLLSYIPTKRGNDGDHTLLGAKLAELHQVNNESFGFETDNFIGSLPQRNTMHADWPRFYVQERLFPQLKLAVHNNLLSLSDFAAEDILMDRISQFMPDIEPALLHGDLWSGNFIIGTDG